MNRMVALPLLFVLAVPLWVSSDMAYPFVSGRALLFRVSVAVAAAVLLGVMAAQRDPTERRFMVGRAGVVLALLTAWIAVTTVTAVDPVRALWGSLERMEGAIGLIFIALFALLLVRSVGASRPLWRAAAVLTIVVSTVACVASFSEAPRWSGPLGSPIYLGLFVVMVGTGLAALGLRREAAWPMKACVAALLALHAWVLWNTQTRGALVAVVAAAAVGFVVSPGVTVSWRRVGGAVGSVGALALGVAFFRRSQVFRESDFLWRFGQPGWLGDRPAYYEAAVHAIAERPLLGWGAENIDIALSSHAVAYLSPNAWADRTHSVLLDFAVAFGLPGLVGFLILFGLALSSAVHPSRPLAERRWLAASLVGWLVGCSFAFPDIVSWMGVAALLAYINATERHAPSTSITLPRPLVIAVIPVAFVLMVVVAVGHYGIAVVARETYALMGATHSPYDVVERTRVTSDKHGMVRAELALMLSSRLDLWDLRNLSARTSTTIDDVYASAIHQRPTDPRLRIARARTWTARGAYREALGDLRVARELAPNNAWLPLIEVSNHMRMGALEPATAAARRAVVMHPSDEAVTVLAALLLSGGKHDEAAALLLPRADKRPAILLDARLVEACRASNNLSWLTDLWLHHAEQDRPAFRAKLTKFVQRHPPGALR